MKTYHFLLKDGIIVGYLDYMPNADALDVYDAVVPLATDVPPEKYMGLNRSQMEEDPLPEPSTKNDYENSQPYRRAKLKELYEEIKFTTEIAEDTTALQLEYNALLLDYNNNK